MSNWHTCPSSWRIAEILRLKFAGKSFHAVAWAEDASRLSVEMPNVNNGNGNGGEKPPNHYLHELPQKEEERLESLFKRLDIDGNGRIDIRDLTQSLNDTGVHQGYAQVLFPASFDTCGARAVQWSRSRSSIAYRGRWPTKRPPSSTSWPCTLGSLSHLDFSFWWLYWRCCYVLEGRFH